VALLEAAQQEGSEEEEEEDTACYICGKSDRQDVILLCDGCENECHMDCLVPPLTVVPEGDWFCPDCLKEGKGVVAVSGGDGHEDVQAAHMPLHTPCVPQTAPVAEGGAMGALFEPPRAIMFRPPGCRCAGPRPWCTGTFEQARAAAAAAGKWLLVNIQSERDFASLQLNRDTWSDETLQQVVRLHCVFWQQDQATHEGQRFLALHKMKGEGEGGGGAALLPVIALIDASIGSKCFALSGFQESAELVERLMNWADRNPIDKLEGVGDKEVVAVEGGAGGALSATLAAAKPAAAAPVPEEGASEDDAVLAAALAMSLQEMEEPASASGAAAAVAAAAPSLAGGAGRVVAGGSATIAARNAATIEKLRATIAARDAVISARDVAVAQQTAAAAQQAATIAEHAATITAHEATIVARDATAAQQTAATAQQVATIAEQAAMIASLRQQLEPEVIDVDAGTADAGGGTGAAGASSSSGLHARCTSSSSSMAACWRR